MPPPPVCRPSNLSRQVISHLFLSYMALGSMHIHTGLNVTPLVKTILDAPLLYYIKLIIRQFEKNMEGELGTLHVGL